MNIEIHMRAEFWLALTMTDLEPFLILSAHHYDSACYKAHRVGGFLFGWKNCLSAADPNIPNYEVPRCSASRRDLDTLLKICETARICHQARLIDAAQYARTNDLCALIMDALRVATNEVTNYKPIVVEKPSAQGYELWLKNPGRM